MPKRPGQNPRVKKTALGVDGKRREWHNIVVEMTIEQHIKGVSGFDRDILGWNVPEDCAFGMSFEREKRA